MAESFSQEKFRQAPQKKDGEILCDLPPVCDPGWDVHNPDVQNKWDDNTHTYTGCPRTKTIYFQYAYRQSSQSYCPYHVVY